MLLVNWRRILLLQNPSSINTDSLGPLTVEQFAQEKNKDTIPKKGKQKRMAKPKQRPLKQICCSGGLLLNFKDQITLP